MLSASCLRRSLHPRAKVFPTVFIVPKIVFVLLRTQGARVRSVSMHVRHLANVDGQQAIPAGDALLDLLLAPLALVRVRTKEDCGTSHQPALSHQ